MTGSGVWKLALHEPPRDLSPHVYVSHRCDRALPVHPPRLYHLTSDPTASSPLDPDLHPEVRSLMLRALDEHVREMERERARVPWQFAWHRLLWRPWLQICCRSITDQCRCSDKKFEGVFDARPPT
jgi:hypothetical protein